MHEVSDDQNSPWSSPGYTPSPAQPTQGEQVGYGITPPAQVPSQTPPEQTPGHPAGGIYTFPSLRRAPFDPLAAASVVCSPISPLGLTLGVISRRRIKTGARSGHGTAVTGIVLSIIFLIATLLTVGTFALDGTFARMNETPVAGDVESERTASPVNLDVGNCVATLPVGAEVGEVNLVPCSQEHQFQVLARHLATGDSYPGAGELFKQAEPVCEDALSQISQPEPFTAHSLVPSQANWENGHRNIICFARSSAPLTGDLLDS